MQRELTRNRIMDGALSLFDELGYHAVTMDNIAQRANLSRGTIYVHFQNKGEILRAIVENLEGFATLHEPLRKARSRKEIDDACRAIFSYWDRQLSDSGQKTRMLWKHIRQGAALDNEVADWFKNIFETEVEKTAKAYQAQGVPRGVARARALLIVSMWTELADRLPESGVDRRDVMKAVAELVDFARSSSLP
ncbi:TetR/AcrR family transcriptional regulator [Mycolicibacterium sp. XJ1819]